MSEMAVHMERVLPFYKIIEKHVSVSLSCKIGINDLQNAKARIWSDDVKIVVN
jgi:hypothetical protein